MLWDSHTLKLMKYKVKNESTSFARTKTFVGHQKHKQRVKDSYRKRSNKVSVIQVLTSLKSKNLCQISLLTKSHLYGF